MDTRYFSRFDKFHHEFDNIIFGVKRGSRYSMMNIALGAVQECGTHLQWVQWDKAYADLLNRVREGVHRRMMKS